MRAFPAAASRPEPLRMNPPGGAACWPRKPELNQFPDLEVHIDSNRSGRGRVSRLACQIFALRSPQSASRPLVDPYPTPGPFRRSTKAVLRVLENRDFLRKFVRTPLKSVPRAVFRPGPPEFGPGQVNLLPRRQTRPPHAERRGDEQPGSSLLGRDRLPCAASGSTEAVKPGALKTKDRDCKERRRRPRA